MPDHNNATTTVATQQCISDRCAKRFPIDQVLTACPDCGELLDIVYDRPPNPFPNGWDHFRQPLSLACYSGVWKWRELLPFNRDPADIVSVGEGRTILQRADSLASEIGLDPDGLFLQYEGLNPSGSFKDNGMAAAFTHARMVNASVVACASTGNTSAAMALFAARAGMRSVVFIGDGKIAYGKLSQALDYGAKTLQVAGDFDACLARVREICQERPELGVYLMNSLNPFRLEGQKTVMYRVLECLGFEVPEWVVVPGGNLGNCSAFGKAFAELRALGLIDRIPRLAVINAHGARTLDRLYNEQQVRWTPSADAGADHLTGDYERDAVRAEFERMDAAGEHAQTIASAIEINRPVNLTKSLRALHIMDGGTGDGGLVRSVTDDVILEHKALIGRHGIGCEPASAASLAGARLLREEGVIKPHERVVCILTGHQLKDPDATVRYHTGIDAKAVMGQAPRHEPDGAIANQPIRVADDLDAILEAMAAG